MFLLDSKDIIGLHKYLQSRKEYTSDILPEVEKPGEGNMNYVLRVMTNNNSFIIKQARPYVEKYPQIAAPVERAIVESTFYRTIQDDAVLRAHMPGLLWSDETNNILALEDFGESKDYTDLYNGTNKLSISETTELLNFLSHLNRLEHKYNNPLFQNRGMRELNHQHIFLYPFMSDNGFDLDIVQPGLQRLAEKYKTDIALKKKIIQLGESYLANGDTLLHGDFYPGSWLRTATGIKVIDPEFCFYGPAVFDIAIMTAHCFLSEQDPIIMETITSFNNANENFNNKLYKQFTGIEIMRRLIGLAQLPLSLSIETKENLLNTAAALIAA